MRARFVTYESLPMLDDFSERHSWDYFGPNDELGCLNFQTEGTVLAASREVRRGIVVNLDLPVGEPRDSFWVDRSPPVRVESRARATRDDKLDNFYLQGGTQWDALKHHRVGKHGYYGGRSDDDIDKEGVLGIDRWAEKGIVGRGVLLDVDSFYQAQQRKLSPVERCAIGRELFEQVREFENVELALADILLVRTGWLAWYQNLEATQRARMAADFRMDPTSLKMPGVDARPDTVAWLWNHQVSAVAIDTPVFEVLEHRREDGWAHHRLLALLGMPMGELWALDSLADVCREHHQYSFLLVSHPLFVRQGTGAPANAYAIL
jgi:kynurenine formamidase